jgi:hypothetical protein
MFVSTFSMLRPYEVTVSITAPFDHVLFSWRATQISIRLLLSKFSIAASPSRQARVTTMKIVIVKASVIL